VSISLEKLHRDRFLFLWQKLSDSETKNQKTKKPKTNKNVPPQRTEYSNRAMELNHTACHTLERDGE